MTRRSSGVWLAVVLFGINLSTGGVAWCAESSVIDNSLHAEDAAVSSGDPRGSLRSNWMSGLLTLRDCLELALRGNPELAASRYEAMAAEDRWRVLKAGRLPTLSAEGGYTRNLDAQRLAPPRMLNDPISSSFSEDLLRGELVMRWPVWTGGRLGNEIEAAALARDAAGQLSERTADELAFEVSRAFYGILAWEKAIGALEFSREALREHRRQVSSLVAAEKAAAVDLLRTDVRLANVEQELVGARNQLALQHRILATALGWPATESPLEIVGELLSSPRALEVGEELAQAFSQRSDYHAARRLVEAQARRVDAARGGRLPTVGLYSGYGGRSNFRDEVDVGSVGVGLAMPLFEGGAVRAGISQERARLAAAQERLRGFELRIRLEVTTALADIESAGERVRATETAIEQARESLRIERQKYELGKGSITDVLDSQSALLEAETNYYRALTTLDSFPGQVFDAPIERIYPRLDPATRTLMVEANLMTDLPLFVGLFARVATPLETVSNAVVVPSEAPVALPDGSLAVFVAQDGRAQRRIVRLGVEADGYTQILEGIEPGESVVVRGQESLREGSAIRILAPAQTAVSSRQEVTRAP